MSLAVPQKHFHWHSCVPALLADPSAARGSRIAPVGRHLVVVALISLFVPTLGYLCPSTYTQVVSSHSLLQRLSGCLQTQGSHRVCTQKPEGCGGGVLKALLKEPQSTCLSVCLLETFTHHPPPVDGYPSITMVCNTFRYVYLVRWTDEGGGRLQMSPHFWWSSWKSW